MDVRMRLVVKLFYINQSLRGTFLHFPVKAFYRFISCFIFQVDLHSDVVVGKGLKIYHGFGLVVNPGVVLGDNVILRHGVTIGNYIKRDGSLSGSPIVGDGVEFGCGAVCVGDISIGDNSVIGANSLVNRDVPQNSLVSISHCSVIHPKR